MSKHKAQIVVNRHIYKLYNCFNIKNSKSPAPKIANKRRKSGYFAVVKTYGKYQCVYVRKKQK